MSLGGVWGRATTCKTGRCLNTRYRDRSMQKQARSIVYQSGGGHTKVEHMGLCKNKYHYLKRWIPKRKNKPLRYPSFFNEVFFLHKPLWLERHLSRKFTLKAENGTLYSWCSKPFNPRPRFHPPQSCYVPA